MSVTFSVLIVKTYRGIKCRDQQAIVTKLGFSQSNLIWTLNVHSLDDVKRIESIIRDKVPYCKIVS